MYKMMAFDYDGTIVDTFDFYMKTMQDIFAESDIYLPESRMLELNGVTMPTWIKVAVPDEKKDQVRKRIETFYDHLPEHYWNEMELIDNARETLDRLREKGIITALVTNSPKKLVEESLDRFDLVSSFDWVSAAEANDFGKHQRLIKMLDALEISSQDSLYVGDMDSDVKAAQKAEMKSCLIQSSTSWIVRKGLAVENLNPDHRIMDIKALCDFVE